MARNDYQKMAGSFLDLWQEQLTRSLSDRDFINAMLDSMKKMQGHGGYSHEPEDRDASPASGISIDELDDLRRRLADCERRLARLERKPTASSAAKPKPKAKKTKPEPKRSTGGAGRAGQPRKPDAKAGTARPAAKSATGGKKIAAKPAKGKTVRRAVRKKG